MNKLNLFVTALMLAAVVGCSGMLSVETSIQRTTQLVKDARTELDKPAELRERSGHVTSSLSFLVFAELLDPEKDIDPFLEIDAVEYFVSVAYAKLVEGDLQSYNAAITEAEAITKRAETRLDSIIEKLQKQQSSKHGI